MFSFASSEVFSFHLEIGSGSGSSGSLSTLISFNRISMPCAARSSLRIVPSTSTADASLSSFKSKAVTPSSNTHCTRPSRLRRITNATFPISRIVCTAPFTFTSVPSACTSNSPISNVFAFFTPSKYSIIVFRLLSTFRCPGKEWNKKVPKQH